MNKWQQAYCNIYGYPQSKATREAVKLLGEVKEKVTVHFPDFNGIQGFKPAHTETYMVTMEDCNMPAGKISVSVLASNLPLWLSRGYEVTHH